MNENIALRLESTRSKVYRSLETRLRGHKRRRLDYYAIAREVGVSRTTVRYHVRKLIDLEIIGVARGKLFLIDQSGK